MSVSGSLMGYENNCSMDSNCIAKKNKSLLNSSKQCSSLNSSITNSVVTTASQNACSSSLKQQQQQQQPNHQYRRGNNYRQPQQMLEKHRLHLNTLWSIWYGVLVTLLQGYLVVQGAHRFLSEFIKKSLNR